MKTIKSSSNIYPDIIDDYSSPTTVYQRFNIIETTRENEQGEIVPWYEFDENQYTRQEWQVAQQEDFNVEVDFRLTMIELEV